MFGNVWEWCGGYTDWVPADEDDDSGVVFDDQGKPFKPFHDFDLAAWKRRKKFIRTPLRGGGFLDDIARHVPELEQSQIPTGLLTRHTDLGFRIACRIRIEALSEKHQQQLRSEMFEEIVFSTSD